MNPILQKLNDHLDSNAEWEQFTKAFEEIIAESPEPYGDPDSGDGQEEPYAYANNNQTSQ